MEKEIYFEVKTPLNVRVRTTRDYWEYIISIKHKMMHGKEDIVKDVLSYPDEIRKSRIDEHIFLYYKRESDKLYCVVARHEGEEGFLLTAYRTDKVKEGDIIWKK